MNFETWLKECIAWQSETFGDGPRPGLIDHLRKEVEEVAANPTDPMEYIDLIFLAVDGLRRNDYDPGDIGFLLEYKLYENKKRQWPDHRTVPVDKAIEHVRSLAWEGDGQPDASWVQI